MRALTDNQRETLIQLVRGGAPLEQAIAHIGRDVAEFSVWLTKPAQKELRFTLGRSMAQANLADFAVVNQDEGWQAAKARFELRRMLEQDREVHEINALALGR